MIRLLVVALICITIYSIYFDLTSGTIPEGTSAIASAPLTDDSSNQFEEISSNEPYLEVEVMAGDTVLTIAEKIANKPIPVSIQQLIEDFQTLNEGISPEKIQIGKIYKFPVY
ncbi:hypothetical protein [Sutcliffiella rhizosphaerae]|uniref:LysM domain-containing protein n=1 Tax=Sutcliffiella rhizosphaerae TaxID=2880967 RepID=A0ABN8A3U4_9BACI|nr:hypothetical protein [Sutcliffiella rhizosphaerae]CAG9619324.1 hypothetical protein BACCIP111883_00091 [Sutcliffiella rhizosphaerae]